MCTAQGTLPDRVNMLNAVTHLCCALVLCKQYPCCCVHAGSGCCSCCVHLVGPAIAQISWDSALYKLAVTFLAP